MTPIGGQEFSSRIGANTIRDAADPLAYVVSLENADGDPPGYSYVQAAAKTHYEVCLGHGARESGKTDQRMCEGSHPPPGHGKAWSEKELVRGEIMQLFAVRRGKIQTSERPESSPVLPGELRRQADMGLEHVVERKAPAVGKFCGWGLLSALHAATRIPEENRIGRGNGVLGRPRNGDQKHEYCCREPVHFRLLSGFNYLYTV